MRKKLIFSLAFIAVACGIGCYGLQKQSEGNNSGLMLANIEALSRDEASGDRINCHSSAKEDPGHSYTDCSQCIRVVGWRGVKDESRCTTH